MVMTATTAPARPPIPGRQAGDSFAGKDAAPRRILILAGAGTQVARDLRVWLGTQEAGGVEKPGLE